MFDKTIATFWQKREDEKLKRFNLSDNSACENINAVAQIAR